MTGAGPPSSPALDVVCCSLEAWDDVWRRNQFLVAELLSLEPGLRVLFVEPPVDMAWSVLNRRPVGPRRLRLIGDSGRLWAVAPTKWLPRRLAPGVDRRLGRRVQTTASRLGFEHPVLWINDTSYAALVEETGWPTVYDVTDDWLLAGFPERELERQRQNDRLVLDRAAEVVVCSPALAATRGASRSVHQIPNGVDVAHIRGPQDRPRDLPEGPIVLYLGTLSAERLDVDLCVDLASALGEMATVTFVGPNSCTEAETDALVAAGAVLLGARPYSRIPGYLQHADVLIVPHVVTPFTESLDPIKAREIVAVGRPAVSTPVAGFRGLGPPVDVVPRSEFVAAVLKALRSGRMPPGPGPLTATPGSWTERARDFLVVLRAAVDPKP